MSANKTQRKAVIAISITAGIIAALFLWYNHGITSFLSFISLVMALAGNYFVNKKVKAGFIVWICANIGWILVNILSGQPNYLQMTMFFLYSAFNVHGYICWSRTASTSCAAKGGDANER
jgi:nicotinamide riboside transporter PnuC